MKLLCTIQHYDSIVFMRIVNAHLYVPLCRFFRLVSKTADGSLYVLAVLGTAWQGGLSNSFSQVVLGAFLIERPVYFVLKNSFKRNRPQAALTHFKSVIVPQDQFSFPSGHTSAAFMMATLGSSACPAQTFPLFFWAAGVGFSRVLLGVHFPSDVLVGATLGVSIAYISLQQVAL